MNSIIIFILLATLVVVVVMKGKDDKFIVKNGTECLQHNYNDVPECKGTKLSSDIDYSCGSLELILGEDNVHMTMAVVYYPKESNPFFLDKEKIVDFIKTITTHSYVPVDLSENLMGGFFSNDSKCVGGVLAQLKRTIMDKLEELTDVYVSRDLWGNTPHTQVLKKGIEYTTVSQVNILDPNSWEFVKLNDCTPSHYCSDA